MYNILFVCAMNRWRSPTAEVMYRGLADLNVRSAGLRTGAKRLISDADLAWCDVVMVMERDQAKEIRERFGHLSLPPIQCLDIPDRYRFMDFELQALLKASVDPLLSAMRTQPGNPG